MPRIAVLGLYNSGSTAVAGMLHRLGVNMGGPFWESDGADSDSNFYEARDLSQRLRDEWWDEPNAVEIARCDERAHYLRYWVVRQERIRPRQPAGAKHPLLSLCADDLVDAWGGSLRVIWCWRPLEESIASLKRRAWDGFVGKEDHVQKMLWDKLNDFDSRCRGQITRLVWSQVQLDPLGVARELARLAEASPADEEVQVAAAFVRPKQSK